MTVGREGIKKLLGGRGPATKIDFCLEKKEDAECSETEKYMTPTNIWKKGSYL